MRHVFKKKVGSYIRIPSSTCLVSSIISEYGLRISPVFYDFPERAHEMWQKDKQEEEKSEDDEEEDYLYLPVEHSWSPVAIGIRVLARLFRWPKIFIRRSRR